jgi:hypothetical protein
MANPQLMTGLGAALSIFLSASGAASGSAASGTFALQSSSTGFASFIPIVLSPVCLPSTVLAIVGVLSSVTGCVDEKLDASDGYRHLCSGLAVGLACLASGSGIATFVSQNTRGGFLVSVFRSGGSFVKQQGSSNTCDGCQVYHRDGSSPSVPRGYWTLWFDCRPHPCRLSSTCFLT